MRDPEILQRMHEFPRPIDLLQRLANTRLPIRIVDHSEIETLRILKLSGSIKAAIPDAGRPPGGLQRAQAQSPATVDEITRLGRILLERFASRSPGRTLARPHTQCL
ncbi:hypothetical protein [Variovorax soli]|uniref:Uncharacterized protein n=1 Tax=Variovorax soli TaxID=376815 RepID=A0ABU1NCY9_9BURK|nr:hypothetical protein [Variovorax soli]MDR6536286.1 hypothetical protein [Variovorax soli]